MSVTTARHAAVPRGSLADRARRNIEARMGELGLSQRRAAEQLGMSQPSLSERASGQIPWRLNEIEAAAVTLEMDLSSILAPVDDDGDDLELSLFEPLEDVRVQQRLDDLRVQQHPNDGALIETRRDLSVDVDAAHAVTS
ncbi:helix-turn-helix transcriptional regulator [Promicromonospora sp. NPDC023805]|uniref:helix-turn-helix domain-containing protein n=1 Tax=Promicromonospora sp. NPDC023805 TaxID=3154696 RepID=UPI00340A9518